MAKIRGGMEFRSGALVRLPPLPTTVPAHRLRLTVPARPDQAVGQSVTAGEVLFDDAEPAHSCVVSPMAGEVKAVIRWTHSPTAHGDRHDIVIEATDKDAVSTRRNLDPPRSRTVEDWYHALRRLGRWSDAGPAFDLISQLAAVRSASRAPDTLICVGLDAYPPYPDRSSLLDSFPDDAVLGTQILADIVGVKNVLILAVAGSPAAARLRTSCRNFRIPLTTVDNIYPAADPTLVAMYHASGRRRMPAGANPVDHGLVLIGPWTAIRVARWFTLRELDMVRPVMIGWSSANESMTPTYAMPGQPLASLHGALAGSAASMAGRVVRGNPMTGRMFRAPDLYDRQFTPVVPSSDLLISVLSDSAGFEREACISCGWCPEVCPTGLRPIRLAEKIEAGRVSEKLADHLEFCVDCGICYVCPSSIPLARILKDARTKYRQVNQADKPATPTVSNQTVASD